METLKITVNGNIYEVTVESSHKTSVPNIEYKIKKYTDEKKKVKDIDNDASKNIISGSENSPLAGIIQEIHVASGDKVSRGDLIVTLESMKMYTPIHAQESGEIFQIYVKVGDSVDEGSALYKIK